MTSELSIQVVGSGVDEEEIDSRTRVLLAEIREADVEDVVRGDGGVLPGGAKAGEVLAVGTLVVTLGPIVVQSVMDIVASWLSRQPSEIAVEIDGKRIEGTNFTKAERKALVDAFVKSLDQ
ncbi:hypothetical protein B0I29_108311 [Actinoplanes lutulentus]|uniref:Uncharacterized protein n=1 Tax=Actinoplanes lutulentus TaxID=1287878 RepID=A0A327ZBN7_9ACTN|nr:hypothetical protein [Actinoplanes lutulentus]RAK36721.1 hypothetical protein B0I29_108311 [Actinoplanes lutulentus]